MRFGWRSVDTSQGFLARIQVLVFRAWPRWPLLLLPASESEKNEKQVSDELMWYCAAAARKNLFVRRKREDFLGIVSSFHTLLHSPTFRLALRAPALSIAVKGGTRRMRSPGQHELVFMLMDPLFLLC